jgi:hypothetical protein
LMMEGSRSGQIMTDQDPGGPKTYGSGTTTLVKSLIYHHIFTAENHSV